MRNFVNIMQIGKETRREWGEAGKNFFFFLFSAPALLAARGSPPTVRSFARRSFDRSKTLGKERDCSQSINVLELRGNQKYHIAMYTCTTVVKFVLFLDDDKDSMAEG